MLSEDPKDVQLVIECTVDTYKEGFGLKQVYAASTPPRAQ